MLDLLLELLRSTAGSFASIFLLGAVILFAVYKLGCMVTKFSDLNKSIEHTSNNINSVQKTLHEIFGKFETITGRFDLIDKSINLKFELIESKIDTRENKFTQSKSPISLTPLGEEVALELKLSDRIDKNWQLICKLIDDNTPDKNAYDIQEYCKDIDLTNLEQLLSPTDIVELKQGAFLKGYSMFVFGEIAGVIIRDKYLKEKGISVDEVDKHDPALISDGIIK
jgi:hypothetical protein